MRDVTESEPTPHTHSVGRGDQGEALEGATRASAPARASFPSVPAVPTLINRLFVGDPESSAAEFWRQFLRRCKQRKDYALHGDWTAPNPLVVDKDGALVLDDAGKPKERILGHRWAYFLLYTVLIAWPIAFVLDFLDWATHPAGRLAATAAAFSLIYFIL